VRRKVGKNKGRRACPTGKVRFRDRQSAAEALHRSKVSTRQVVPVRCYECPLCHGFHLTSRNER